MEAKAKQPRGQTFSTNMAAIARSANIHCLYAGPAGMKFIDWPNSCHKQECRAEKFSMPANGTEAGRAEFYRQEYFNRLTRKFELGPDYANKACEGKYLHDAAMPDGKSFTPVDDALFVMRNMMRDIVRLDLENNLLAQIVVELGCQNFGNTGCAEHQNNPASACARCWRQFALARIGGHDVFAGVPESLRHKIDNILAETPVFEADEIPLALATMIKMKHSLFDQRFILACHAMQAGCPESGDSDCPSRSARLRSYNKNCVNCWLRHVKRQAAGNCLIPDSRAKGKNFPA